MLHRVASSLHKGNVFTGHSSSHFYIFQLNSDSLHLIYYTPTGVNVNRSFNAAWRIFLPLFIYIYIYISFLFHHCEPNHAPPYPQWGGCRQQCLVEVGGEVKLQSIGLAGDPPSRGQFTLSLEEERKSFIVTCRTVESPV